jgi:phosphoribosylformimino-5-aminoimidazole carboxamide ribotide isomerase
VIERLQNRGVRSFVYTNVDRDGMLGGPDPTRCGASAAVVRGRFLYSGGIGTLDTCARCATCARSTSAA